MRLGSRPRSERHPPPGAAGRATRSASETTARHFRRASGPAKAAFTAGARRRFVPGAGALRAAVLPALLGLLPLAGPAAAQDPPQGEPGTAGITSVELEGGGESLFGAGNYLSLIIEAGPVAWTVLLVLLGFSLVSWAIIFSKTRRLRAAEAGSAAFLQLFRTAPRFTDVVEALPKLPRSPLAQVFSAGYQEMRYQSRGAGGDAGRLTVANMEAVARSLLRAASGETARLEERMTFLATTGSATPFIGLFGTVWGIMNAFQDIGFTQTANISVVAPGVSEALIATAAGLAAAIPAVIAYNAFLGRIRRIGTSMDEFSLEYVTKLERHFAR